MSTYFSIRQSIRNIIDREDDAISGEYSDIGCELEDLCGNQVVNQSYKGRMLFPNEDEASMYDFIQATIVNGTFSVVDFEDFTKIIANTKKDCLLEKFKVRLGIIKMRNRIVLKPQLFLKKDNGVPYAISQERLCSWGVAVDKNNFKLSIKSKEKSIWEGRFTKCLRGDYIMYPKKGIFDLKLPSIAVCEKWDVYVDDKKISSKAIQNPLDRDGFIQLYSIDGFVWNSQPTNNYEKSAILFDSNRVTLKDDTAEALFADGYDTLKWISFDERIVLDVNGKERSLYNKAGSLEVELQNEHPIISSGKILNLFSGNRLPYRSDVGMDKVYIISTGIKPSFKVYLTRMNDSVCIEKENKDITQNVEWYYKKDGEFTLLQDDSIQHNGYVELKIYYGKKNKERIIKCFALNPEANIVNNPQNQTTSFQHFDGLTLACSGENLANNVRYWQHHIDVNNPIAQYSIANNDNGSLEIKKYCPIQGFLLEDKRTRRILFSSSNQPLTVPTAILGKTSVRNLPEGTICNFNKRYHRFELKSLMRHEYTESCTIDGMANLRVKPFTHFFDLNENRYQLNADEGNFINLSFVFMKLDNYEVVPISVKSREGFLYFDIGNLSEGIIIQDLNAHPTPSIVVKPMYVHGDSNNTDMTAYERRQSRFNRINDYHMQFSNDQNDNRFDCAISAFKVAAKTGMYFGAFDSLLGLFSEANIDNRTGTIISLDFSSTVYFAEFLKRYCDDCDDVGTSVDFESLWRMSDEFLFDWILIPRDNWSDEYKQKVTELLRHKPGRGYNYLNFVGNRFWNFVPYPQRRDDERSMVNVFLRTISQNFVQRHRNVDDFWMRYGNMGTNDLDELDEDAFYEIINDYINQ